MLKRVNPTVLYKPISLLASIGKQARNYTRVVVWLVYEAFRGRVRKVATALFFNFLYLGGQMGAIAVIYGYARLMERHAPLEVPWIGITVDPSQPEILWGVVAVSALLFLVSGFFQYLSRRITFQIAEDHFAKSLKDLIVTESRLPDPRARMASRMLVENGLGKITAGSRRGALMAVIFFNASAGAIGALAALAFLVVTDPVLTLFILLGVGVGALSLYPIALRGVRFAKLRERTQAALNKDVQALQQSGLAAELGPGLKTADEFAYAYMGRRRVVAELTLVIGVAVTVILALVVYYMANQALSGSASWAVFIAYIGALRLVLAGSTQMIRAFAGVSRFYPQIVPYYALVQDYRKVDQQSLATVTRDEALSLGTQANGEEVIVRGGDRLAVATTDTRRQIKFALLDAKVPSSGKPVGATIIRSGACQNGEAALAMAELDNLSDESGNSTYLDGLLRDKVTLFVHQNPKTVGAFGETSLLTIEDGSIRRFLPLGTSESDLVLEEFARKASARSKQAYSADDEEEDDV